MPYSLYITPENFYFDDDLTNTIMNDDILDNEDVVMVAGMSVKKTKQLRFALTGHKLDISSTR